MKAAVLTIDIGSTNMKAVLFDTQGGILHLCSRGTRPDYLDDQRVELDGGQLRGALLSLLRESNDFRVAEGLRLTAIGVTSQRSSVVAVDAAGDPLMPIIMWHDKRTASLCDRLRPHEERVFALSGMTISPVYSAVKMLWLKEQRPAILARAAKLLGIHDFALHTLCGRFVTDHSLASSTNLLNIHSARWDPELLAIFSVERRHLCDLVAPGSVCGSTTAALKAHTGIPTGTPVITAGGDQQCGAMGQGVLTPGKIKCTTGTGSYLLAFAASPVIDTQKRFLCKVGAVPGTYCLEAGIFTTGTVYRWFREQFYREETDAAEFTTINSEAAQSPPGANGVIMLPHFEGSGAPHWNPADRGTFHNLRLSTTRGDLARAILEAIGMETRENIQLFQRFVGPVDQISVAGGMTALDFYNQLQADIFGSAVITYPHTQATALGAWMSVAVSSGLISSYEAAFRCAQRSGDEKIYTPNPHLRDQYDAIAARRLALYRSLLPLQ
ncbi:MAG: FGGY-family carbohydrate kinase [Desulfosarcinaceae bacterium]|nr:FGGY-family carbohydrate kinase [Desulfosarcinaceae bacterium]